MNVKLREEKIQIGERILQLNRVADIDALYEGLIAKGPDHEDYVDERIPYWAELWPSAIGLARYIEANPHLVKNKDVLEIGCGIGLPGIIAGLSGGRMQFSDYLPEALELARLNWNLNGGKNAEFVQMDWRTPPDFSKAVTLLASDVAYEKRSFVPLYQLFDKVLNAGGCVLMSEPNRMIASDFRKNLQEKFPQLITRPYNVEIHKHKHFVVIYKISG